MEKINCRYCSSNRLSIITDSGKDLNFCQNCGNSWPDDPIELTPFEDLESQDWGFGR